MNNVAQFPELDFCVTFFQIVTPDNRVLSPRFETYEQTVSALGSVLDMTAIITEQTVYFSEANELGRCELLAEIITPEDSGEFDVICFQIIDDTDNPVSKLYETREQAHKYLSDIKQNIPAAKITKYTFEFSSKDDEPRIDLLSRIVKPDAVPSDFSLHVVQPLQA